MTAAATPARNSLLAVLAYLPAGATLRMDDVLWSEYEELLAGMDGLYHAKVAYNQGRMEIMSPVAKHEKQKNLIYRLLAALSDELEIEVESLGSTTYRKKIKAIGVEPDDSFYIQNAEAVMNDEENVDLAKDPPPDLVVEIEHTSSSLNKLPIYLGLGVRELWFVRDRSVQFLLLVDDEYQESEQSEAFPFLTAAVLSGFLKKATGGSSRKAAHEFRQWVRKQISS